MIRKLLSPTYQLDLMAEIRMRFNLTVTAFGMIMIVFMLLARIARLEDTPALLVALRVAMLLAGLIFLILLQRRRIIHLTTDIIILATAIAAVTAPNDFMFVILGFAAINVAAMLASVGAYAGVILAFTGKVLWLHQGGGSNLVTEDPYITVLMFTTIVGLSWLIRYASHDIHQVAEVSWRTTNVLQAIAEIGQATSQLLDLDALFSQTVELLRDRLGYYHAQIFLIDDKREYAELVASTGKVGQLLIERRHKLAVGSQSVIGRATQAGKVVIARDTDRDIVHARNELLPNTRSEIALPIIEGEQIIGALDVQSVDRQAFDATNIQALRTMANQLAVSVRNIRLFEAQAANLQENKRLYLESEANLREIQRLNRQLTGQVWKEYWTDKSALTGITVNEMGLTEGADWTPAMLAAIQKQRTVVNDGEGQIITVPIVLRGEVIGAIEVEPGAGARTEDTTEMIRAIAGNLAVSLDNARLFEEAQESTAQEQRINEIVQRYQAAATVDELLQITLTELGETLGAQRGQIRLGSARNSTHPPDPRPDETDPQNGGQQS